jgi:hypothetical protein
VRTAGTLLILALSAGTASAEVDDELAPMPHRQKTLSILGRAGVLAGQNEGGVGPNLELALGSGRWQYFVEGALLVETFGPEAWHFAGYQGRGGVGVRWLARSFEELGDGTELALEAFAAVEHFWWSDGDRLTRPDFGAGFSWQIRELDGRHALRVSTRVYFAPDRDSKMAICRGVCDAPSGSISSGIIATMGVAW